MSKRPYCICEDQGTCIGCMIETKIRDPHAMERVLVNYYYGTSGLEYYDKHMKQFDFREDDKK